MNNASKSSFYRLFQYQLSSLSAVAVVILMVSVWSNMGWADTAQKPVQITKSLTHINVKHFGKPVRIERNQDTEHVVDFDYSFTSRPCPPFCVQPLKLAEDVETIGELELLDYLKRMNAGDKSIVVIDSRTPEWLQRGMIPGAINIPWTKLYYKSWNMKELTEILQLEFNTVKDSAIWNFENAKTLILYCNGIWCGQSPSNIKSLLLLGYPHNKLKWYRGGMQSWKTLGFTTVLPDGRLYED